MANRPKGFGMSADLARKAAAKYDSQQEANAIEWIEAVLGRNVFGGKCGQDHVHEVLKDGTVLVELANALRSADPSNSLGCAVKGNASTAPFKQMENISNYLSFCSKMLGVEASDCFQTVDLYEKQNMDNVIKQINAVGRKAQAKGLSVRPLGPKEATENKREFTEEQLKEGKNVIGIQMGTNKLASQAGEHFGRPRQVAGHDAYN